MQSAQIKAMVQEQAVRAALEAEKQLDRALKQMDDIGENEIQALRKQRLKALKDKQAKMAEWRAKGHGSYNEVASQKDWFNECKDNERVVCHFFRGTTWRCEIVDKHLEKLAAKHMETRFIKIDAEKSPFLAERLKIVLLPTVVMTRDGHTIDMLEGFDDLGGNDKFTTKDMEKRLARNGAIDYEEEAVNPNAKRYNNKNNQSGKAIYQSRRAQMMENIEDDLEDLSDLSD